MAGEASPAKQYLLLDGTIYLEHLLPPNTLAAPHGIFPLAPKRAHMSVSVCVTSRSTKAAAAVDATPLVDSCYRVYGRENTRPRAYVRLV